MLTGAMALLLTLIILGWNIVAGVSLKLWIIGIGGLIIPLLAWAVGSIAAGRMSRRLGGLTGDTYGALNELIETMILIYLVLLLPNA